MICVSEGYIVAGSPATAGLGFSLQITYTE